MAALLERLLPPFSFTTRRTESEAKPIVKGSEVTIYVVKGPKLDYQYWGISVIDRDPATNELIINGNKLKPPQTQNRI